MKKYLVIGNPIEHSLSPQLHNYWFQKVGIDAVYDKKKINEKVDKIIEFKPDILFSVDSPDFTLRVAEKVKKINPKFICFFDDDCIVDRFWLKNVFKVMKFTNARIVTGPQLPLKKKSSLFCSFTSYFSEISSGSSSINLEAKESTQSPLYILDITKDIKDSFFALVNPT